MRILKYVVVTILAVVLWTVVTVMTGYAGWWHKDFAPTGDAQAFHAAVVKKAGWLKGNVAILLLENGEAVGSHFDSIGNPVNEDTVFQAASISKWVSAWGVMVLVEQGALDLDAPVSTYLTRWFWWTPSFGQVFVTAKVESRFMIQATLG